MIGQFEVDWIKILEKNPYYSQIFFLLFLESSYSCQAVKTCASLYTQKFKRTWTFVERVTLSSPWKSGKLLRSRARTTWGWRMEKSDSPFHGRPRHLRWAFTTNALNIVTTTYQCYHDAGQYWEMEQSYNRWSGWRLIQMFWFYLFFYSHFPLFYII